MSTILQVEEQRQGNIPVLLLRGRMDSTTSPEAEGQLNRLIGEGAQHIVIDFSDLEYISSAGLRVLLAAQKRMKQTGGTVLLVALRPEIRKVFDIAGFNRLFSISPSIEEALGTGQGR